MTQALKAILTSLLVICCAICALITVWVIIDSLYNYGSIVAVFLFVCLWIGVAWVIHAFKWMS